jgi:hypothetical protein
MVSVQLYAAGTVQCKYFMHNIFGCTENIIVSTLVGAGVAGGVFNSWLLHMRVMI